MRIRIRKDGVREVKVEDEIFQIPHEHEICERDFFAAAWRQNFFVDPKFVSVGRRDIDLADALVLLAACHDLASQRDRLPCVSDILDGAIRELTSRAQSLVPSHVVVALQRKIRRMAEPKIEPSVGRQFEDDVWYSRTAQEGEEGDGPAKRDVMADFSVGGDAGTGDIDLLVAAVEAGEVDVNSAIRLVEGSAADLSDLVEDYPEVAAIWNPVIGALAVGLERLSVLRASRAGPGS